MKLHHNNCETSQAWTLILFRSCGRGPNTADVAHIKGGVNASEFAVPILQITTIPGEFVGL
jgi:hypothetical protein